MLARGIGDPGQVRIFLESKLSQLRDPHQLPGVTEAAQRIARAIADRRRIVIYGDYDADGMTGASILLLCLRLLGANAGYYIPNRFEEGYGLNCDALRTLAGDGAQLVVTVDCGITSLDEADLARELGLELIVTDHHQPADRLPDAVAIVHPQLPGHSYPFAGLSGAGVAFKLAWALCQEISQSPRSPSGCASS
jgi:single-stranded-DNA-specific exonuclease